MCIGSGSSSTRSSSSSSTSGNKFADGTKVVVIKGYRDSDYGCKKGQKATVTLADDTSMPRRMFENGHEYFVRSSDDFELDTSAADTDEVKAEEATLAPGVVEFTINGIKAFFRLDTGATVDEKGAVSIIRVDAQGNKLHPAYIIGISGKGKVVRFSDTSDEIGLKLNDEAAIKLDKTKTY